MTTPERRAELERDLATINEQMALEEEAMKRLTRAQLDAARRAEEATAAAEDAQLAVQAKVRDVARLIQARARVEQELNR